MEIEISTPALLFPALSLLLLAYTNRFLTTGQLARMLGRQLDSSDLSPHNLLGQIKNLKLRLELTKWMQFAGVVSILFCTLSMFFLFLKYTDLGGKIFGISLVAMVISLLISLWEVMISTKALNYDLEGLIPKKNRKTKD